MRLYRWLLYLYPARFREEYAAQMERQFREDLRDSGGGFAFWMRALADLAISIPAELGRELSQDLRYAARLYKQRKLVTALALGALAVAIGATTGVFSVVNALLIRELPYREPGRIVEVWQSKLFGFSTPTGFRASVAQTSGYLEDAAIYTTNLLNVERNGVGRRRRVTETSANFLALLGTVSLLGRNFLPDEHEPGKNQVAILSHSVWQQDFGNDSSVLGTKIAINGLPVTIVGIAPPAMDYPTKTEVWTPTALEIQRVPKSGGFFLQVIGRIKDGLSLAQARAMYQTQSSDFAKAKGYPPADAANQPRLTPLRDQLTSSTRKASLVLFAGVALILLIACANVAQVLLARLNERRQELTVRSALGATRARILQQLVTESLVLTSIATLAGVGVAYWTTRLISKFEPEVLAAQAYTVLDFRVLGFAVALAIGCGLLFGVLPSAIVSRLQPSDAMGNRATHAAQASRIRWALIATQAMLTVLLLAGSVSMGQAFLRILQTDMGYQATGVVTFQVALDGTSYKGAARAAYYRSLSERIRAIPGVEVAGPIAHLPLEDYAIFSANPNVQLEDGIRIPGVARFNYAGAGYFSAMRQPIVAGRDFTDAERSGVEKAVLVSENLARSSPDGLHIVGRRYVQQRGKDKQLIPIVGVVRSANRMEQERELSPEIYYPVEASQLASVAFAVRVRGEPASYAAAIREAVKSADPAVPLFRVEPLETLLAERLARPRFYTTAITFFGVFALLLSAIGIYGVAANSVAQRTQEIGVRIAVGASTAGIRAMLLRQTLAPLALGLAAGILAATGMGQVLHNLMTSAEPIGMIVALAAAGLLAMFCTGAVWQATLRVTRVDPIQALRAD